jgi:hypothetical protein
MERKLFITVILGLGICMVSSLPATAKVTVPKPKTVSGSVTITGTTGSETPGECAASGYEHQCPSGSCLCFAITGAKASGKLLGSGTADVSITLDEGDSLDTTGTIPTCDPVYGQAILTLTGKSPGTETINFQGTVCEAASLKGKATAGGAWQIFQSTNGESGLGTVTGQGVISGTDVDLTLTGSATTNP